MRVIILHDWFAVLFAVFSYAALSKCHIINVVHAAYMMQLYKCGIWNYIQLCFLICFIGNVVSSFFIYIYVNPASYFHLITV